jgi:hypothetical protein
MAPIWVRISFWTSLRSSVEGTAEGGCVEVESVTKANGRWPLSAVAWNVSSLVHVEERRGFIATVGRWSTYHLGCQPHSILQCADGMKLLAQWNLRELVVGSKNRRGERTGAKSMCGNIDDIVGSGHDMDIPIVINHSCISSINPLPIKSL